MRRLSLGGGRRGIGVRKERRRKKEKRKENRIKERELEIEIRHPFYIHFYGYHTIRITCYTYWPEDWIPQKQGQRASERNNSNPIQSNPIQFNSIQFFSFLFFFSLSKNLRGTGLVLQFILCIFVLVFFCFCICFFIFFRLGSRVYFYFWFWLWFLYRLYMRDISIHTESICKHASMQVCKSVFWIDG